MTDDFFEENGRPDGPGSDRDPDIESLKDNALAKPTHTITMTGLTHDDIVHTVMHELAQKTAARISHEQEQRIRETIEKCVDKAVTGIVDRELDAEIRRIIAEGWHEHSTWGERTGKRFTLADRVTAHLKVQVDGNGREGYGGKERYKQLFEEAVNKAFNAELGKVINAMIAEAKKMLDDEFKARFAKAMKAALGIYS